MITECEEIKETVQINIKPTKNVFVLNKNFKLIGEGSIIELTSSPLDEENPVFMTSAKFSLPLLNLVLIIFVPE